MMASKQSFENAQKDSQTKYGSTGKNSTKKSNLAEIAVLSLGDFERIKKNSTITTKEEERNKNKILADQKENTMASIKSHKEKLKEIDQIKSEHKKHSNVDLDIKRQVETFDRRIEEEHDVVKDLNKMVMYTNIAMVREKQIEQTKQLAEEYRQQQKKMDVMMELERLRELELQDQRYQYRKEQQKLGSVVIIDQIKERELERLRVKELQEREKHLMQRQIKELEEEDKRAAELKKIQLEKMAKEVERSNKRAIEIKERKKLEEKEVDMKIHQYIVEKARKEEEELLEKKRIQEEKEMEVAKLREKQEKARDKQAELDAIKAKRALEETERQARAKEKKEIQERQKKVEELIKANEKAKLDKELKLAEEAQREQMEFVKIIDKQLKDIEADKRKEDQRKEKFQLNKEDILMQIKKKEELEVLKKRKEDEEGRAIRQKAVIEKLKLEKVRETKLQELKKGSVPEKFLFDIHKYKIK